MSQPVQSPPTDIACNLLAIAADERPGHIERSGSLFGSVLEVQELADGYAFRLPVESETLLQAAQFIANERLCCPFFTFTLRIEPNQSAVWLTLTGDDAVKEVAASVMDVAGMMKR